MRALTTRLAPKLAALATLIAAPGAALAHPGHGADEEGTGVFHMLFDHPVALAMAGALGLALVVRRVRHARSRSR